MCFEKNRTKIRIYFDWTTGDGGIIAILIGILMPVLGKARVAASNIACQATLHGMAVSFRIYLIDYNDYMPPAARYPSLGITPKESLAKILKNYIESPESLKCVADNGATRKEHTTTYFESEGSSYEYMEQLGGKRVDKSFLSTKLKLSESDVHVIYDYDHFHGDPLRTGSVNYLYADGHVGDRTGR